MRNQVKSGEIELESNEESCQAYSEIKDLEFHSRSKISFIGLLTLPLSASFTLSPVNSVCKEYELFSKKLVKLCRSNFYLTVNLCSYHLVETWSEMLPTFARSTA